MEVFLCPKCGSPNPDRKRFCENCGYRFPEVTAETTENTVPVETNSGQNEAATEPVPAAPTMQQSIDVPVQPVMQNGNVPVQPIMQTGNVPVQPVMQQNVAVPVQPYGNGMTPYSPQMQEPKKKGGGLIAVLVILILLLLGCGGAAAYLLLSQASEPKEIEVSDTSIKIEEGEVFAIDITNYDELGDVILSYSSDDDDVAEIIREYDDGFDVEGIEEGRTTIIISGEKMEDVEITVKVTAPKETAGSSSHSASATAPEEDPDASQGGDESSYPEPAGTGDTETGDPDGEGDYDFSEDDMPYDLDGNSDGSYNLWSYGAESIVGKIYVVDGYTIDDEFSGSSTIFCDSDTMNGIYYTCYAEMPYSEWAWLELGETPEEATNFSMTSHDLGLSVNGSKLYYAERTDDSNEFGETEMYYIYYSYYCADGGYTDYVAIELYPEQAANWDKEDYQDFARAVFGL